MGTGDDDSGAARASADAYDRYLSAMDAAMRVKVAGAAAHLRASGRVADMGMGSGAGSFALASLYPQLEVIGVDLDPEMVARARERYQLPNLSFVVGDVADPPFEPSSLDGVFDSSVLHHVTSFGGYDHEAAARALAAQVACLREGGQLIVRDFLAPALDDEVWLELPTDDGDAGDDPRTCSSAALFERFTGEFRSLHPEPGFPFERGADPRDGWIRVRLRRRHAVEFVLRKDYRRDWEAEVREEYTYFDQDTFTEVFERLGLRLAANAPILNPWIVQHRFEGRFAMFDLEGVRQAWPATNVLVAGERVEPGRGFAFDAWDAEPIGYLGMKGYVDRRTGLVLDLVARPGRTLDVVPYWQAGDGDLFVVARHGYPRPILGGSMGLDGSLAPSFVREPIVVVTDGGPTDAAVEAALAEHGLRAAGPPRLGHPYWPSPGAIQERVQPVFVPVEPEPNPRAQGVRSGFGSDGRLRAMDARQVLRAAEVGAMPDARLALHVRALHAELGLSAGPWIGAELEPPTLELEPAEMPSPAPRVVYADAEDDETGDFLAIEALRFTERDRDHAPLASQVLEAVRTTEHGDATLVLAAYALSERGITLALCDDDRPASQLDDGSSAIVTVPAYRVPEDVTAMYDALRFLRLRVQARHGLTLGPLRPLGGPYYPAPGLTAELVHVVAAPIATLEPSRGYPEPLVHVPLAEIRDDLRDGHTRIALARLRAALSDGK